MRGDRLARHWRILKQIEVCRNGLTAAEVAELGDISLKTAYRDLEHLEASGFPIYPERGEEGGQRWKFIDSYRFKVPPPFTLTELLSLQMSEDLFRVLEGTAFHDSIQSLLAKVRAALPPPTLALLDRLRATFRVSSGPCKRYECFREIIDQVNQAVVEHRQMAMVYQPLAREEETRRTVDPYGVRYADGTIYIVGHCHLRGEIRIFVLDRIRELTLTDHTFTPPEDFDLEAYFQHSFKVMQEDLYTVKIRILPEWAKWVGEKTWHQSQQAVKNPDGSLDLTFQVAGLGEIQQWIMSLGPNARVLAPESLKVMVREGLKQALAQYDEKPSGVYRSKVGEPAPFYDKDNDTRLWDR